jgi:hypothetical protein
VQINNYLKSNSCSNESQSLALEFLKIIESVPDAMFVRYKELNEILQNNPWALIQNCAEQNGLDTSNYLDLYNHTIPQACIDKLNALPGYNNQPISEGNVPLANIDYYSVEITTYPDFDGDNNPDTEAEIYQEFRNKFIDLASGEKQDFQFSCNVPNNDTNTGDISWQFVPLTLNDLNLFVSNNPISSIFLIDASADVDGVPFENATADEGAIIVSGFTSNDWTISTIYTPQTATQPFSGNRQWGWIINQNGNLELFTRAVDVAKLSWIVKHLTPGSEGCKQDTYYKIAQATWENMQQEIVQWINEEGGGQAEVIPKIAVLVDRQKIKELLESNETINQINCN